MAIPRKVGTALGFVLALLIAWSSLEDDGEEGRTPSMSERSSEQNQPQNSTFLFSSHNALNASASNALKALPPNPKRKRGKYKKTPLPPGTVPVKYYCHGPVYANFTQQLRQFCQDQIAQGLKPPTWGMPRAFPPNRNVLFFGNSHTRQLALALLDQHSDEIVNITNLGRPVDRNYDRTFERRFDLKQNSSIYLFSNSYQVHSPHWATLFEQILGRPLSTLDAIILGVFNSCRSDINTTYATKMMKQKSIDCLQQEGPTVADVAHLYPGPLALVPMFALKHVDQAEAGQIAINELLSSGTRRNVAYIPARRYIDALGIECGAAKDDDPWTDCLADESHARETSHRCIGKNGGHPDLVAWDVLEFLQTQWNVEAAS